MYLSLACPGQLEPGVLPAVPDSLAHLEARRAEKVVLAQLVRVEHLDLELLGLGNVDGKLKGLVPLGAGAALGSGLYLKFRLSASVAK